MKKVLYILGMLADEDIDWMAASGVVQTVPPGFACVREGQPVDSLFLLVDGSLRVEISKPTPARWASWGPVKSLAKSLSWTPVPPAPRLLR